MLGLDAPAISPATSARPRTISKIAQASIARIGERARAGDPVDEHEVTRWILEAFDRAGLVTESAPSVSYGEHAARVHYEAPAEGSSPIVPGQLLLLDLWAKEPGGIYADQTWMAAIGTPSARAMELWTVVRTARDAALDLLRSRLGGGQPVAGADADRAAREVIDAAGYGDRIVCRTGHSIDRSACTASVPRSTTPRPSTSGSDRSRRGLFGRARDLFSRRNRDCAARSTRTPAPTDSTSRRATTSAS